MALSDLITEFIMEILEDSNGSIELQRTSLANHFDCVPSQINYVISTRFSPERGFIVESRRGEGGYIRITRVSSNPKELIMRIVNAVGNELQLPVASALVSNLLENSAIDRKTSRLILAAVGDNALKPVMVKDRDTLRASIFKQLLVNIIYE